MTDIEIADVYSPAALLAQFELAEQDHRSFFKAMFEHRKDREPQLFLDSTTRSKMSKADAKHVGYAVEGYLVGARCSLQIFVEMRGPSVLGRNFMDFYVDYLSACDERREAFHLVLLDRINARELEVA